MTATENTIYLCIAAVLATVLIIFIRNIFLFKHKVRVYDLGGQSLELDFKAREIIIDGVMFWFLNNEKNKELRKMPIPPAGAIRLSRKGKKSVTAIRTETGEYIFLSLNIHFDVGEYLKVPDKINSMMDTDNREKAANEWKEARIKELKQTGVLLDGVYQPFTTKQRMVLMSNFEKARIRKKHSWKENIPVVASMAALTILIVSLFIFWGDLSKPYLEGKQMNLQIVEAQKQQSEILSNIQKEVQRIESIKSSGGGK